MPNEAADAILAENFQLKDDLSIKIGQIADYEYTVQEYSDRIVAESEKNRVLQMALNQSTMNSSRLKGGAGKA